MLFAGRQLSNGACASLDTVRRDRCMRGVPTSCAVILLVDDKQGVDHQQSSDSTGHPWTMLQRRLSYLSSGTISSTAQLCINNQYIRIVHNTYIGRCYENTYIAPPTVRNRRHVATTLRHPAARPVSNSIDRAARPLFYIRHKQAMAPPLPIYDHVSSTWRTDAIPPSRAAPQAELPPH